MKIHTIHHEPQKIARSRSGVTTLELIVAMILLGILTTSLMPILQTIKEQRLDSQYRTYATQIATNLMEELTSQDQQELYPEAVSQLTLSSQTARLLPHGKLTADLASSEDNELNGMRLSLQIDWKSPSGQPARPVRLSAFVYPQGDQP